MSTEMLFAVMAIIFFAGLSQSLTGFGFGLVAAPLMTIFLEPSVAIPIILIEGLLLNIWLLASNIRRIDAERMGVLALAGLAGVPVGVFLLTAAHPDSLRVYLGLLMLAAGALLAAGVRVSVANERVAGVPVGLASGVLCGSLSLPGPPIILFFANQGLAPGDFRANLVLITTLQLLVALPFLAAGDLLGAETVVDSLLILPALALGAFAGKQLFNVVRDVIFRRLTLGTVACAGLVSVAAGLGLV